MKKFFVVMAVVAMMAMAIPAVAADNPGPTATVGGRILMDTGYRFLDKELTANGQDDVSKFFMQVMGWSYLRATFTSADKTVGGRVELGAGASENGTSVSARHVYGWWKVGACTLTVGNTNPPFGNTTAWAEGLFTGPYGYVGAEGYGYTYTGRRPTIMLNWASEMVEVTGAISNNMLTNISGVDSSMGVDVYTYWPRFDLNVKFAGEGWAVGPGFYVAGTTSEGMPSGVDEDYVAWAVELPVRITMGGFIADFQVWYAVNNAGQTETAWSGAPAWKITTSGAELEDTVQYGGYISLAYQMGAMKPVFSIGMMNTSNDAWEGSAFDSDNFTIYSLGAELQYDVADNFKVVPGFTYYNNGDNVVTGDENGNEWAVGVHFRFVF